MVMDKLGSSLKNTLEKIKSAVFVDDKLINEIVKDIQKALLQSDVNVKLVLELSKSIKERAKNEKAPAALTQKEHMINIVYEELTKFVGGEFERLKIEKKPFRIMLVGLFGNGKTTSAGKLGKYFKNRSHKVCALSLDVWRPAAFEQLRQVGEQAGIKVFGEAGEKDPAKIYKKYAKELDNYDIVIVDTAGRDALSEELVEELGTINSLVKPDESFLVIGGDIGQSAQKQASMFKEEVNITGVVITKMDGTAKGGGALAACSETGAPVRFIGVGEGIDDLEEFKPEGFIGQLLGMGDLEALLEKASLAVDEEQAKDMGKKFLKGDFTLIDLYEQMNSMKKMGSLSKIADMIPGLGSKIPKDVLQTQEGKLELWKHIMNSMTRSELEDPSRLGSSRISRIADGSGNPPSEVRALIKHYKQSKKMMKMFKGKGSEKQMQKMIKIFRFQ